MDLIILKYLLLMPHLSDQCQGGVMPVEQNVWYSKRLNIYLLWQAALFSCNFPPPNKFLECTKNVVRDEWLTFFFFFFYRTELELLLGNAKTLGLKVPRKNLWVVFFLALILNDTLRTKFQVKRIIQCPSFVHWRFPWIQGISTLFVSLSIQNQGVSTPKVYFCNLEVHQWKGKKAFR